MILSMNIFAIPNIDVKVCTHKSELSQGNLLHFLTQPKITRQRTFELTGIHYYLIKYEIEIMKCVEYDTNFRRNVLNVDDIEDFTNL